MSKSSYGFGLEKLGLLSLRAPRIVIGVVLIMTTICGYGLTKLSTDTAISDLFRSSSVDYKNYELLNEKFPTSEYDILIVLEGDNLLKRENIEKLRDLPNDLKLDLEDELQSAGVISLFDVREPTTDKKKTPPLIVPEEIPEGKAYDKLLTKIEEHPLIGGRLLSKQVDTGTRIMTMQLTLKKAIVQDQRLSAAVKKIETSVKELLGDSTVKFYLAGTPIMQLEIRSAIKRDRLVFNVAGFVLGFFICFLFFRRTKLALIASICPVIAVVWSLGIFALLELKLTTLLNIIPPLILVIAYSDAMHIVYSIRRRIAQGDDKVTAIRISIMNVGPACVLTSLTTSLAMLSLAITDSSAIVTFALCAAFSTIMAFLVIILVVPALSYFLIGDEAEFRETEKDRTKVLEAMERMCGRIAGWLTPRFLIISFSSALLIGMFGAMHLQLKPHYKLSDQLPDHKNVVAAAELIDQKLEGAFPINVMVKLPAGVDLHGNKTMAVIKRVHDTLDEHPGIGNVWSLELLRRWVFTNYKTFKSKEFAEYIDTLPTNLKKRMLSDDRSTLLFTGHVPNLEASEVVGIIKILKRKLSAIQEDYPEFKFEVTGLLTLTSLQSRQMITQLNQGLLMAVVIVIILIGIAFRSYKAALLSLAPNILPIAAAGALLYVSGNGLEYASVIGLTVAFGLAVDDSIHFMNRFYLERSDNENWELAVYRTVEKIGPVLMLTTIVLVLGLAVTILSDLPPLRLFGLLSMTTLAAALAADLIVFPAVILSAIRLRLITQGKESLKVT